MKRPLFIICCAFVLTLAAMFYMGLLLTLSLAVVSAAGALLFYKEKAQRIIILAAVISSIAGMALNTAFTRVKVIPLTELTGESGLVSATITELRQLEFGAYGEAIADISASSGREFRRARIQFEYYGAEVLEIGASITGEADISPVMPFRNDLVIRISEGVFISAEFKSDAVVSFAGRHPLTSVFMRIRERLAHEFSSQIGGDAGGLLNALLTGDDSGLSKTALDRLRESGISHLISVSGLHITFAAATAAVLFRGRYQKLGLFFGALIGFAYAGLAGFTPSALRAAIMFLIMAIGSLIERKSDALTSLGVAGVLICAYNPYNVASLSFQMSFLATMGIVLSAPSLNTPVSETLEARFGKSKLVSVLIISFVASLGAVAYTAPVSAAAFGNMPLYGIIANMLTALFIPLIMYAAAACALCFLLLPAIAPVAAFAGKASAGYILGTSRLISGLPLASLPVTESYFILILAAFALLFYVITSLKPLKKTAAAMLCFFIIASCSVFAVRQAIYFKSYDVLTFKDTQTTAIIKDGVAIVLSLPADADKVRDVGFALERLGIDKIDLLTCGDPVSARILADELPVELCFISQESSRPIGVGELIPMSGGEVRAMGLNIGIDEGEIRINGSGFDASEESFFGAEKLAELKSPTPEVKRYAVRW